MALKCLTIIFFLLAAVPAKGDDPAPKKPSAYSSDFLLWSCQKRQESGRDFCNIFVSTTYVAVVEFSKAGALKVLPLCLPNEVMFRDVIDESVIPFLLKTKRENDLSTRSAVFDVYLALLESYPCPK